MTTRFRWHVRTWALVSGSFVASLLAVVALDGPAQAAQGPTFKVAYFNVQSGKGSPGLPGRPIHFFATSNCTDSSQPLNAW
ncbi:MAG: hypothetical protein H0W53_13365, partial [Acidobacteria bacterium]|nr:hypothetical protein [Acidobacteriota bacterium]